MIFLLGGTSETSLFAQSLAARGVRVLVSTATDEPLHIGNHPNIHRRTGMLNREQLKKLLVKMSPMAIVDVTHPYAREVRYLAETVARELGIPYFTWIRPPTPCDAPCIKFAMNHHEAAQMACSFGRPVLLTTGTRNLEPYVIEAQRTHVKLVVRVLDSAISVAACRNAGIPSENIITGRGPFSVEQNLAAIDAFDIGTIVTKDSGAAGGVPEKVEACLKAGCWLVVVQRPVELPENSFSTMEELIQTVMECHKPRST